MYAAPYQKNQTGVISGLVKRRIVIYLHTFGYAVGSLRSIKTRTRLPIHPNYLIDARELPPISKKAVIDGVKLSSLDGRYDIVRGQIDRYDSLSALVDREVDVLASKIVNWDLWDKINVAIGSHWGRHRAVAVQYLMSKALKEKLNSVDIEPIIRLTYFGFQPKPMVAMVRGRSETVCD